MMRFAMGIAAVFTNAAKKTKGRKNKTSNKIANKGPKKRPHSGSDIPAKREVQKRPRGGSQTKSAVS